MIKALFHKKHSSLPVNMLWLNVVFSLYSSILCEKIDTRKVKVSRQADKYGIVWVGTRFVEVATSNQEFFQRKTGWNTVRMQQWINHEKKIHTMSAILKAF